jgi:hypothetical protein
MSRAVANRQNVTVGGEGKREGINLDRERDDSVPARTVPDVNRSRPGRGHEGAVGRERERGL